MANWPLEQFDAQMAENKRDFDTRFAKARALMAEAMRAAHGRAAGNHLRDKAWNAEAPRRPTWPFWSCLPRPTQA